MPRAGLSVLVASFALLSLLGWAVASPVGASPDEDYHLSSIWCAAGDRTDLCETTGNPGTRMIPEPFTNDPCYSRDPARSAECQDDSFTEPELLESARGNFAREYPPVFYGTMSLFASNDVLTSVLIMRSVNAALFTGLLSALLLALPAKLRMPAAGAFLITSVPLTVFLIPSINPSSWAVLGVGTSWIALVGWFRTDVRRRRTALAALAVLGAVMAAGARADAAVYVVIGVGIAVILEARRQPRWWRALWLPALLVLVAAGFLLTSGQIWSAIIGFGGAGSVTVPGGAPSIPGATTPETPAQGPGWGLALSNLVNVPSLWGGALGFWSLGWFDTPMPAVVAFASVGLWVAVAFSGLSAMSARKAIAFAVVVLALWLIPTWTLTRGGDQVGSEVQPRYLLPLIIVLAGIALFPSSARQLRLGAAQRAVLGFASTGAFSLALYMNLRRYLTGNDVFSFDLGRGLEWWWAGLPSPMALWALATLAWVGMLVSIELWLARRRALPIPEVELSPAARSA